MLYQVGSRDDGMEFDAERSQSNEFEKIVCDMYEIIFIPSPCKTACIKGGFADKRCERLLLDDFPGLGCVPRRIMKTEMPVEIDFGSLLIECRGKPEIGKSGFGKEVEDLV